MISFIGGTLLNDEPCKFMLKSDIKNYFQKFTKTFSTSFQWNTTYTDLAMRDYVCAKYGILTDKYIQFIG